MTAESGQAVIGTGLAWILLALVSCVALAVYVFFCFCYKKICEKCGLKPGVIVWIPIFHFVPLLRVAKLPVWLIVAFIIPPLSYLVPFLTVVAVIVMWVVFFIMWAKVCVARGKSGWLVLLFLV